MSCLIFLPRCKGSGLSVSDLIKGETPSGAIDCVNLAFTTANVFASDTLEVMLDGNTLTEKDFTIGIDNKSFTLVIDISEGNALNSAPKPSEDLRVNYVVTTTSSGGSGCLVEL